MEDKELDGLFKSSFTDTQLDVDVHSIWDHVQKKKKRRYIFILFLFGALSFIGGSVLYNFMHSENVSEPIEKLTNLYEVTEEENKPKEQEAVINNETHDYHNNSLSQINKSIELDEENQLKVTLRTLNNKIPISYKPKVKKPIIPFLQNSTDGIIKVPEFEDDTIINSNEIAEINRIELHSNLIKNLGLKYLKRDKDSLKELILDLSETKKLYHSIEFSVNIGMGAFNSNLSGVDNLVSQRNSHETDRFSSYVSGEFYYWKNKSFGISLNGLYQKSYSYFEALMSNKEYLVDRNQTKYFINTRNIKSNIIIDQIHLSTLINYKYTRNRIGLIASIGPSYNVYTNGVGKFFLDGNIVNYSEGIHLKSSNFGIASRVGFQYSFTNTIKGLVSVNYRRQLGDILIDDRLEQTIQSVYFTSGLNYAF